MVEGGSGAGLRVEVPGSGEFQRVVGFRTVEAGIELNLGEEEVVAGSVRG